MSLHPKATPVQGIAPITRSRKQPRALVLLSRCRDTWDESGKPRTCQDLLPTSSWARHQPAWLHKLQQRIQRNKEDHRLWQSGKQQKEAEQPNQLRDVSQRSCSARVSTVGAGPGIYELPEKPTMASGTFKAALTMWGIVIPPASKSSLVNW